MTIPESKFDDWHKTGADSGSKKTADKIRRILKQDRSPTQQSEGDFQIRLQGSYKNTTHTRGSSDVDILARLTSAWTSDLSELDEEGEERYHEDHTDADYGYDSFSSDVWGWLKKKFKHRHISWNGKAIEISKESSRLPVGADIVPCIEHRHYTSYPARGGEQYDEGMAFETRWGSDSLINYPHLHWQNGNQKHTNYKETVRIFKNARDYYNESYSGILRSIDAHSYGIECLIYNVPTEIIKRASRSERFIETLEFLEEEDLSDFDQVSEMELLFGSSNTQWEISEANDLIEKLRDLWEEY